MEAIRPETVAAIKGDEFARASLQAAKEKILAHHRDWSGIHPEGKLMFDDDQWGILYLAICSMLDNFDEPEIDADIMVGGVKMKAGTIQSLNRAFRKS